MGIGAEVGSAHISVVPSAKNFGKKLSGEVDPQAEQVGLGAGKRFGSGLVKAAVAFVGAKAVVGFLKDSVSEASNLNEEVSKSKAIFGEGAKAVIGFAKGSADTLGQSQQQALSAAANFGVFGKSAGLSGQALADFSTDFVGLASDLASFNNTSPEEAILAIGAGLRGETEPLRRFGVLMDDASLRNEALKLGIISTTKDALTPQQKVLAAQALIYQQTSDAQGDFAKTSDQLANKQRIMTAEFTNLKAEVGQALLPVMLELIGAFQKDLLPVLEDVAPKIGPMIASFADVGAKILEVAIPAISAILDAVGFVIDNFPGGTKAIGLLVTALLGFKLVSALGIPSLLSGIGSAAGSLAGVGAASTAAVGSAGAGVGAAGLLGVVTKLASRALWVGVTVYAVEAITGLIDEFDKGTKRANEFKDTVKETAKSITPDATKASTDAYSENTKALVDNYVAQSKTNKAYNEAGEAAQSVVLEQQKTNDVTGITTQSILAQAAAYGVSGGAMTNLSAKADAYSQAVNNFGLNSTQAKTALESLTFSMKGSIASGDNLATTTSEVTAKLLAVPNQTLSELKGDQTDLQNKINLAQQNIDSLPPDKQVDVLAQIAAAQAAIQTIQGNINSVTGKTVTMGIETGSALSALQYMQDTIDAVTGKTVYNTVATKYTYQGAQGIGSGPNGEVGGGPGKADGGAIVGAGGPRSDKIPAMLSNGEHVWTAAEVAAIGGQSAMYQMRAKARAGQLPRFAGGGAVAAPAPGPVAASGGGRFTGNLYLSGGEFLGAVDGQIDQYDSRTQLVASTRRPA